MAHGSGGPPCRAGTGPAVGGSWFTSRRTARSCRAAWAGSGARWPPPPACAPVRREGGSKEGSRSERRCGRAFGLSPYDWAALVQAIHPRSPPAPARHGSAHREHAVPQHAPKHHVLVVCAGEGGGGPARAQAGPAADHARCRHTAAPARKGPARTAAQRSARPRAARRTQPVRGPHGDEELAAVGVGPAVGLRAREGGEGVERRRRRRAIRGPRYRPPLAVQQAQRVSARSARGARSGGRTMLSRPGPVCLPMKFSSAKRLP